MSAATPTHYVIRRAFAREEAAICALVRGERLNPNHLHYENFAVAVSGGELIGASQIRRHKDGSRELGSVVVARSWRGHGISAAIIEWLLRDETGTLFAITRRKHADHYARFGFAAVPAREAPRAVRRNYRLGSMVGTVMALYQRRPINRLTILKRPGGVNVPSCPLPIAATSTSAGTGSVKA
jgi:amino-acid N-acetyltransferase